MTDSEAKYQNKDRKFEQQKKMATEKIPTQ